MQDATVPIATVPKSPPARRLADPRADTGPTPTPPRRGPTGTLLRRPAPACRGRMQGPPAPSPSGPPCACRPGGPFYLTDR